MYVAFFLLTIVGWILFGWQWRKNGELIRAIENRDSENNRIKMVLANERKIFGEQLKLLNKGNIDTDALNNIISRLHTKQV